MPSPEFHRSFPIGTEDNFRVNFLDVICSTNSKWIQSKHDVEILSNHNKATKIAYFASTIHANCLQTVTELKFSTFNQNSSNKEMTTYDLHLCLPSVQTACKLQICSLRRSSEPKQSNILNACNVKWPVMDLGRAIAGFPQKILVGRTFHTMKGQNWRKQIWWGNELCLQ